MTPSERVLESWREHARDGFLWESLKNFKPRYITTIQDTEVYETDSPWRRL
jgi:hypothetical protein